ncbi:putative ABC transport system permease protein [Kitasatospora gansuensis]|uniref:Putative ABC transport system permease protein n=1 Tax=Kitasatospora gansuensis TaxID=258050 RepID=A0A7W7WFK7_9ACTN|nr:hypothetical protein [Kitasatospora gansuensis]MBB4944640.1 putative ABC transport system permease protein [Kitasatospora gansuensis]
MLTLRLLRREARIGRPVAALLALLAVLLTAVPLSWPPRFDELAAATLADRLDRAQLSGPLVSARSTTDPRSKSESRFPVVRGTLDRDLNAIGTGLRTTAVQPLAAALGSAPGRATTPTATANGPGVPTFHGLPPLVSLAYAQPGPDGPVEYVQGRAPQQPAPDPMIPDAEQAPIEVAVSEAARVRLGLTIGQRFDLDGEDWRTPVTLVGAFRTDHGAARLWQQFPLLVTPATVTSRIGQQVNAQLLTSSGGIEQAESRGTVALELAWDLPVAVDRSGRAATRTAIADQRAALADLRTVDSGRLCREEYAGSCVLAGHRVTEPAVTDRLTRELDAFAAQRGRTEQLQGFALVGLLTVVVATAVAAARLGVRRRAGAFSLQLSRGARLTGIAGRLLAEAAGPVGLGVAVGWALGRALAPTGAALGSAVPVLVAAVLVWCAPAAVLLGSGGRTRLVPRSRRLVLEALVLLLAAGGLAALRARGALAGSGIDLQLALVPVLLAFTMVLTLLRLLPPLLLRATRWAGRSSGLVPLVALARAGAQSGAAALALLVLVLAMGSGVFGSMVARTLADSRAQNADWRTGGAPTALVGSRDRLPADLSKVRTVGHQVTVTGATGELTSPEDGSTVPNVTLLGLDAAALRAADPSSPLAAALSAADGTDAPVGKSGASGTEPVLTALADPALARAFPDGTFEVAAMGTTGFVVQVVGALPAEALRDPALGPVLGPESESALLVFTGPSAQQLPVQQSHPSALLLYPTAGGPPLDPDAVRTAVAEQLAPTGVTGAPLEFRDRAGELAVLRADGLVRSVELAFRLATGIGLLLALGAVALELVLSATERARTTSYLRTLGLGGRALLGLQLLQTLPLLLTAAVGGTALGLLLPGALGPGLQLRALTGGPFEPAVHVDWTATSALGLAVAALVLGAAALEAVISRRRGLGAVLRLGEAL